MAGRVKADGYGNAFEQPATKTTEKEEKTFKGMMCKVFENTTAHGIPNIQRSETMLGKVVWGSLFISAVGLLIYQSHELMEKYFTYPADVQLDIEYNSELDFPAVTICNINPIRLSKLGDIDSPDEEFQNSNQKPESDQCDGIPKGSKDPKEEYQGWDYFLSQEDPYNEETTAREEMETLGVILAQQSPEKRREIGHQIQDLLVSCSWVGYVCSYENFTREYFNSFHGNCYTFNTYNVSNKSSFKAKKTRSSGPSQGLSLILFIEQYEYLSDVSSSAGVRVVIHDQARMPFPEEEGYFVPPGYHTSIALRRVEISRLSRNTKPCKSVDYTDQREDFFSQYGANYSQRTCTKTCYQQKLMEICGCYDIYYPNNETGSEEKTVRACNLHNKTDDECIEDFGRNFTNFVEETCKCDQPCHTISYTSDISMSYWPSDNYKENLKESLINFSKPLRSILEEDCKDMDSIRKNLLALDIYYQDLNYEVITQVYSYTFSDLIGAIGGLVGLWLGLSILTVFEGIELCIDLTRFLISKTFPRKDKNHPTQTPVYQTNMNRVNTNQNVFYVK